MDELFHHGIKGQKWGVRRFQNPDGTLTTAGKMRLRGANRKSKLAYKHLGVNISPKKLIANNDSDPDYEPVYKEGSTVTHITPNNMKKLKTGQDLYVSAEKYDKVTYKTWLSLMLKNKGYGLNTPIKEVSFKLSKDLKAPSKNNQKNIFNIFYKNNKHSVDSDMHEYYVKNKNKSYNKKEPYDDFIKSLDKPSKSKSAFYKELRKNGYNAVLDVHDINGSWMNAKRPLIVMEAKNILYDMKIKDINKKDLQKSFNEYIKMNGGDKK